MRLTCPNCGAQYEIPDDVIPQAGRDVQCSNCGDTWFQSHPDHVTAPGEDDDQLTADVVYDGDGDKQADDPDDSPAAEAPAPAPSPQEEPEETDPHDPPAAARRRLDPEVTNVLREEADREAQARAREAGNLESQPDLGLDDDQNGADRRSREARARMARLRGEPDPEEPQDIDPASRRGLLPDIEEINSSLRNGEAGGDAAEMEEMYPEADETARGGSFRRGFLLVVLLAAVLTLLYVFAPQISRAVPALADVMTEYVGVVNDARAWLDGQVAALMLWLDGMASGAGGDAGT